MNRGDTVVLQLCTLRAAAVILLCSCFLSLGTVCLAAQSPAKQWQGAFAEYFSPGDMPDIRAHSFALVDSNTRMLLLGRDVHERRHPASLTKLMTLLLAHELGRGKEWVQISRRAAATPGSSMGIRAGERWRLADLMFGVALPSGNDAAVAVAEHLAGSVEQFARLMNERAEQLAMYSSEFRNPHGLTHPDHITTAHDLALLAAHVMRTPALRRIVSLRDVQVKAQGGRILNLSNTNRLLRQGIVYRGVKTGTTRAAGACLIAAERRGKAELIAVVVKSHDRYNDARRGLNWGFSNFLPRQVAKPELPVASVKQEGSPWRRGLYVRQKVMLPLPKDGGDNLLSERVNRPGLVPAGAKGPLGELVVGYGGEIIYRTPLYGRPQY